MARYLCTRALSFRWRRRASARVYLHIYPAVVPINVEKSEKNPGFTFPVPIDVSPYHQRLARGKQRSSNRGRFVLTVKNVEVQGAFTTSTSWNGEYAEDDYKKTKMVNDAVDSALDSDDIEDEIDEEVDKVLTSLAGETAAQLPEAVRKEKLNQTRQRTPKNIYPIIS
ncbi:hypothetical protein LXL04_028517 [Taraxacum kok-saghyz]